MEIEWLFNRHEVSNRDDVKVTSLGRRISALNIDSVNEENSGNYTCLARNEAGESSFTANLIVKGT